MIVSPPFLPEPAAGSTEEAWLDAAMAQPSSTGGGTFAPEGSFPLSRGLAWHNGVHLQAPWGRDGCLGVRAIADGRVVFVHAPTQPRDDIEHPLDYNPFDGSTPSPAWTHDGMVVVEHTSEIGATGTVPTQVVYYSACMHLSGIAHSPRRGAPWKAGDTIYRKEEIGAPGQIYGHGGQIHFEICCDAANLGRLIGRAPDWADPWAPKPPKAHGRTDSVFGSVHVYLPAGTPTSASRPTHHLRTAIAATATDPLPANTLQSPQWVQITCAKGHATLSSFDISGQPIGTPHTDPEFEYRLYAEATQRHASLAPEVRTASSSPSGWYELLRFGRNLGGDPLPANAAHWREIPTARGPVWADLAASGTFVFSDADFLAVTGWNCFDDDASPSDQRCDSLHMKTLVRDPDPANAQRMERAQMTQRLGEPEVRAKLRRTICRFPSEWDRQTIEARHAWVKSEHFEPIGQPEAVERSWTRFVEHARAVSFENLPEAFLKADWRFHPREFIGTMRKCGWLSVDELIQMIPMHALRVGKDRSGTVGPLWEAVQSNADTERNPILRNHRIPLNRMMRKYCINTPLRQAAFLGNAIQETGWLGALSEIGGSGYWYSPWHGRGFLQLTHASNYIAYWEWRGRIIPAALKSALMTAQLTEGKKSPGSRSKTAMQDANFSAFPQSIVGWRRAVEGSTNAPEQERILAPSDSAGFYWASLGMARYADGSHTLERVAIDTVNGQGSKVYYRSPAFWEASAAVNLPASIGNTYSKSLNGFDSRCCAYGYAMAVLSEMKFPNANGALELEFPEGYLPRRS
jgi:predicted chitinase